MIQVNPTHNFITLTRLSFYFPAFVLTIFHNLMWEAVKGQKSDVTTIVE